MENKARVLIAEDSPTQAARLQFLLESDGFSVTVATDGRQGLELARQVHPSLIISDVVMPEMDGYAFCRKVKSDPHLGHIPFILLTSLSDTTDVIRGLECGADNFLTKPYEEKYLLSRVASVLSTFEFRRASDSGMGVEIVFSGHKYVIKSEPQQILDLLLSTYETAVQKNLELTRIQDESRRINDRLEELVVERTAEIREQAVLLDLAQDAIKIVDEEGRVSYWNQGAERVYGWKKSDALGKSSKDLLQPVFETSFDDVMEQFLRDGHWEGEVQQSRKDGTRITVHSRWTLPPRSNSSRSHLVISTDVSDRKLLENQLRQAQKMEAVGQLAGGVAHDFNNLLTVIMGRGQLLLDRVLDERDRSNVDLIIKTGARAAALTHQLLAFSRKQVLIPRVIDLSDVVADVMKMLTRVIGEDVKLVVHSDSSLGRVKADPNQIVQILMNLVVNARDAMPHGGTISIETRNVQFDETYVRQHVDVAPGHYTMLVVSDTGCGMDAETQAKIFEPFFTTKELGKGTGLGLSTVYGIVKQSGGAIWVYSEVGRGTTFKIYLPRTDASIDEVATVDRVTIRGNETILLVEDDSDVRSLIEEILQMKGYRVLPAMNAQQAIQLFESSGRIDLLITDVIMPGLNGRALSESLRAQCGELKVLFMSGYTDSGIIDLGILESGTAFLQKPVTTDSLTRKVREVLDGTGEHRATPATVLLVDDDENLVLLVCAALSEAGLHVIPAAGGFDAWHILNRTHCDVLITDVLMPGKDGIELIRQTQEQFPNIEIIAMSGAPLNLTYLSAHDRFQTVRVVSKPFEMTHLLEVATEVLRRKVTNSTLRMER